MAMPTMSVTKICNMALSNIGTRSRIESITEHSVEAEECALWYDYSLLQSLEAYDWSFARKRQPLSLDGYSPPAEWIFQYQYPADCVAMRRIWNPAGDKADAVPYEKETNPDQNPVILTNMEDAVGVYTFFLTNSQLYTPFFVSLLGHALGSNIAWNLTGDRDVVQKEANAFTNLTKVAPAYDANERVGEQPRDAEWIRGRTFAPYYDPYGGPVRT